MRTSLRHLVSLAGLFTAFVAISVGASIASSTSASTTVSVTVPSSTSLTNNCRQRPGWDIGTVLPGSAMTTSVGGDVCSFNFGSSNDTASLQLSQADRSGQAMSSSTDGAAPDIGIAGNQGYTNKLTVGDATTIYGATGWDTSGEYLKSVDAGQTFASPVDPPIVGDAYGSIAASSALDVWRFNGWLPVRYSGDGGTTWNNVGALINGTPEYADASSANAIVVGTGGNYVEWSKDGGATWNDAWCMASEGVEAADDNTWYVAGGWSEQLCRTTDGQAGPTWITESNATGGLPAEAIQDVDSVPGTPSTVFVSGGNGMVAYSTDSGDTWTDISTGTPYTFQSIAVISATEVVVAGVGGRVYHTNNTGGTWTELETNSFSVLMDIVASDATHWVVSGTNELLATDDGGATWTDAGSYFRAYAAVAAYDDDLLVAVGSDGTIDVSSDGGGGWTTGVSGVPNVLRGVGFSTSTSLSAVGHGGVSLVSDDQGLTWTQRSTGTSEDLNDLAIEGQTAIAVGDAGTVLTSADGGRSWTARASGTAQNLESVAMAGTDAVAVGWNGTTIYSADSGASWSPGAGASGYLRSVGMYSNNAIYAAGGDTWKSTDGGATWTSLAPGMENDDIVAVPNDDIIISATDSYGWFSTAAHRSTDGGLTWNPHNAGFHNINDIAAVDGNIAFLAGDGRRIRKTTQATQVADYAVGVTDWDDGADMFGGCLQALSGVAASGWTVDVSGTAGQCEAADTDPWNPISVAPVKVATTAAPGAFGDVDLVWGFRAASNASPETLSAGIHVEAVAPNV